PGPQVLYRMPWVTPFPGQLPGCDQRRNLHAQSHQVTAVIGEVIRVGHPVALNVWPVGILRVRPPVIALGKEIVRAAATARTARSRDRDRLFGQILVRSL